MGSIDFGGSGAAANNNGAGFDLQEDNDNDEGGDDWANFGAEEPDDNTLGFARPALKEVLAVTAKGKGGTSGLKVSAGFFCENSTLSIASTFCSTKTHSDFQ